VRREPWVILYGSDDSRGAERRVGFAEEVVGGERNVPCVEPKLQWQ
jgi:hypothetical protein